MRVGVHGELGNPSKKHGVWCLLLSFGASGMKGIVNFYYGISTPNHRRLDMKYFLLFSGVELQKTRGNTKKLFSLFSLQLTHKNSNTTPIYIHG